MEGSGIAGEEEMSVSVEQAWMFLYTWMMVESNGSISTKVFRKYMHTDTHTDRISISTAAICWNTREKS